MGMLCTYVSLMYMGIFTGTVNQEAAIKTLGNKGLGHILNDLSLLQKRLLQPI